MLSLKKKCKRYLCKFITPTSTFLNTFIAFVKEFEKVDQGRIEILGLTSVNEIYVQLRFFLSKKILLDLGLEYFSTVNKYIGIA